jgi:hypothetical protein
MVVRDYLVNNFKMDDTRVRTLGTGKSSDASGDGVSVLIYAPGTIPPPAPAKSAQALPSTSVNAKIGRGQ